MGPDGLAHCFAEGVVGQIPPRDADHPERFRQQAAAVEDVHADAGTFRSDAKNVFQELSESKASFDFSTPQVDLYKKAQETEQKSRDFYLKQAEEAASPGMKETLLAIAHEEKLHYDMLETMIELVSRPQPGNWLENAEWYHSDEY